MVQGLQDPDMVKGIDASKFYCQVCDKSKIVNNSFKFGTIESSSPGEKLSLDLHGPLATSRFGHKYFMVTIDNFTSYAFVISLRRKNDAFKVFVILLSLIERQTGNKIKSFAVIVVANPLNLQNTVIN